MAIGITNKQYYQDIADAIREKNGTQDTYTPSEMAQAILDIQSGIEPNYLYFISPTDGTVKWTITGSETYVLQHSYDKVNWEGYTMGDNMPIYANKPIYWKGYLVRNCSAVNYIRFSTTVDTIEAYGSCNSLFDGNGLSKVAPEYCFNYLFDSCKKLKTPPELPATILENYCYFSMFYGCSNLEVAPELPAIVLAPYCYGSMFTNCTSLITAPELPATILQDYCYTVMFSGCSSLVNAPELPATTLQLNCYNNMFAGCTSLVNAPELPATTLQLNCYNYMFKGCTSLVNAPELPATTLQLNCYNYMFAGCTHLKYIKLLYKGTISSSYFSHWVENVSATGDFYYNGSTTTRGVSAIPTGWTVHTFTQ